MKRSSLLVPLLVFAVCIAATYMVERAQTRNHINDQRLQTFYKLSAMQSRFENALSHKLVVIRSLQAVVSQTPHISEKDFHSLCLSLAFGKRGITGVFLSQGHRVTHVLSNQAALHAGIPLAEMLSPKQLKVIKTATASRSLHLSMADNVIVAAKPIYENRGEHVNTGPLWGTAIMFIDPDTLFLQAGLSEYPGIEKALRASIPGNGWITAYGQETVFTSDPVTMNVLLPQGYWVLAAVPQGGWKAPKSSEYILTGGSLFALLLATILWFTEHQVKEREVAREEYMHLVHNARSLIMRLDMDGNIAFINEYALLFYKYTREELIGKPFVGTLAPEQGYSSQDVDEAVRTMINEPANTTSVEMENIRKDGEHVWVLWTARPSFDSHGRHKDVLCVGTDVTKRRQMEEALRKSETKYRMITENITDVIWGLDANMRFTFISPSDRKLRGFEPSEVLGRPLWDFISASSKKRLLSAFSELEAEMHTADEHPETMELTLELLCKKGGTVWVETRATILYNEEGEMIGMQGVSRNISDRRRADALREDMERMARHDLKTPLGAVIGLPDEIISGGNLEPQQVEMLNVIREAGEAMLSLINRSLDLYKMESGTYELSLERIDLLQTLEQIRLEARPLLRSKGVSFGTDIPEGVEEFHIMGERPLIHAMLSNLIRNAITASPESGSITISLRRRAGVRISVHNMGEVPPELREEFFAKYTKAKESKGSGLGTYSVHLMARTHGGRTILDTSRSGQTTVTIILPDLPLTNVPAADNTPQN